MLVETKFPTDPKSRGKVLVWAFSRLRISKFVVHQARRSSQIIPQKYYKNQIELDHNFVVYEAFQILTQQNKEGQIYRFVENLQLATELKYPMGYKFVQSLGNLGRFA